MCLQTCACNPYNLYGDNALKSSLVLKMSNKENLKDFEAMTEKNTLFHPVNLSFSRVNKVISRKPTAILFRLRCHCSSTRRTPGKWYNTHSKTLSNLNATWDQLVFACKEKMCTIFTTNCVDLT